MLGRLSNSPLRSLAALFAVTGCSLALAACGSSGKKATASNTVDFLNFSKCMRSHGVQNFPDPSPGGGIQLNPGAGVNPFSPSFQSAQATCKRFLPGGGPPAQVSESQKLQALKFAQCMRAHGVPNFPDPTFPKSGGILQGGPAGINPNAPAFQHAARACGGPNVAAP